MNDNLYAECKTHSLSWFKLAKKYGWDSPEKLRSAFRRERLRREGKVPDNTPEDIYEEGHDFINIICASPRMLNKEDVLKQFNVDMNIWEVERYRVKTSEGYRKDRKVDWHVKDGSVTTGDVEDTGKMLVVPLYHIEVRLIKRTAPSIENIIADLKQFESTYSFPKIKYPKLDLRNEMLEVSIVDLHLGKLAWGKETGEDYDSKIAQQRFINAINDTISRCKSTNFEKIIFPVGNDFLNSDTISGTTTKGTQQTNDTRWQKMFFDGVHLLVEGIDTLSNVAPVEIFWIPGNHDTMSSYYVLSYLSAWYKNSKSVQVDISPAPRKYKEYGNCLIGFSHGVGDSKRISQLMQVEAREAWGRTLYHEFHLADLHHEAVTENVGLIVRRLSSLTSADDWHSEMGFVGAIQKAQGFVWSKERGLLQIINSPVKK